MKNRIKIYTSITLAVFSINVYSQEPAVGKVSGGMGGFSSGYKQVHVSDLNASLKANNFPTINDGALCFGGGGYAIINNLIIGGEGHGTSRIEGSNNTYQTAIDGGYGQFDIGYVIYSNSSLLLYPLIGLGSGVMNVKIGENPTATSISSILTNPRKEIHMRSTGFMIDLKLGVDYIIGKKSSSNQGSGGLLLGVSIGYNYVPVSWKLKWEGTNVINAPTVDLGGPYIKLTFGGGGFGKL